MVELEHQQVSRNEGTVEVRWYFLGEHLTIRVNEHLSILTLEYMRI